MLQPLTADGFDEAIIGYVERAVSSPVILYDKEKCIEILARSMSYEEAVEYFEYNVLGSWVGEGTPVFATLSTDMEEIVGDLLG